MGFLIVFRKILPKINKYFMKKALKYFAIGKANTLSSGEGKRLTTEPWSIDVGSNPDLSKINLQETVS